MFRRSICVAVVSISAAVATCGAASSTPFYFTRVFGFREGRYAETQSRLLNASTFEPVNEADLGLWRPRHPLQDDRGSECRSVAMFGEASLPNNDEGQRRHVGERCEIHLPTIAAAGAVTSEKGTFGAEHHRNHDNLHAGVFYTPSVHELRDRVRRLVQSLTPFEKEELVRLATNTFGRSSLVSMSNVVGDSRKMHSAMEHKDGVFQAASQFNYLEFPHPEVLPESGISAYETDPTQGPACACACAAGTAYRNYLALLPDGSRGQTATQQLNGLADVTKALTGSEDGESTQYYTVRNGYVESTKAKLQALNQRLADKELSDRLIGLLRVGVQEDTQVTDEAALRWETQPHVVTQVYCSALSIGYSHTTATGDAAALWEPFAVLVLRATYEATLLVSTVNTIKQLRRGTIGTYGTGPVGGEQTPRDTLPVTLLTKVGGGVFGNKPSWIRKAMTEATDAVVNNVSSRTIPLHLRVVHFGTVDNAYEATCRECEAIGADVTRVN